MVHGHLHCVLMQVRARIMPAHARRDPVHHLASEPASCQRMHTGNQVRVPEPKTQSKSSSLKRCATSRSASSRTRASAASASSSRAKCASCAYSAASVTAGAMRAPDAASAGNVPGAASPCAQTRTAWSGPRQEYSSEACKARTAFKGLVTRILRQMCVQLHGLNLHNMAVCLSEFVSLKLILSLATDHKMAGPNISYDPPK